MASRLHLDRLRALRRQLGLLLDQELVPGRINAVSGETPGAWVPAVDIRETDEAYEILAELPGVRREDLELRVEGAQLELLGSRQTPKDSGAFHRMEGRYGPFHRAVSLGPDADEEKIEAQLAHGVLTVRVGKIRPSSGAREISVQWGDSDG